MKETGWLEKTNEYNRLLSQKGTNATTNGQKRTKAIEHEKKNRCSE